MEQESSVHKKTTAAEPVTGLQKIIWIRQMLQRWQSTATGTATRRSDANTTSEPDALGHLHIKVDTATGDNEDIKSLLLENGPLFYSSGTLLVRLPLITYQRRSITIGATLRL
jgi:hypothetical protein